jgi:hypothetical protein
MSARLRTVAVLVEMHAHPAVTSLPYTLRPAHYFGTTDLMPHSFMPQHIPFRPRYSSELGTYTYFPLYHVFVALSSHVLGQNIDTSLFITTGLIFSQPCSSCTTWSTAYSGTIR